MYQCIGIILAGGLGLRFRSSIPKQYMKLNGKEIIAYSIKAFREASELDGFIVVVDEQEYNEKNMEKKYGIKCIKGGSSRNESLYNALEYIKINFPDCKKIIVHEAARPFIRSNIIDHYLQLLDNYRAVITTVKITDSLGSVKGGYVNRDDYYLIQAPEAFWLEDILKYFSKDSNITATIQQFPDDFKIYKNYDFKFNFKITYPEDLFIAEQFIKVIYYNHPNQICTYELSRINNVFLLGGSGGVGSEIVKIFKNNNINYVAPSHDEVDLENITIDRIKTYLRDFVPDIIINAAAASSTDNDGLLNQYDRVFNVNLKANIVLIEYAATLKKKVNLVLMSSSSSTKGRENITLYSSTKAALNSIVESLAEKMAKQGVIINAVVPEKISTPLIQKLHKRNIDKKEMLKIEEVVDAILEYSVTEEYGKLVQIRNGL